MKYAQLERLRGEREKKKKQNKDQFQDRDKANGATWLNTEICKFLADTLLTLAVPDTHAHTQLSVHVVEQLDCEGFKRFQVPVTSTDRQ